MINKIKKNEYLRTAGLAVIKLKNRLSYRKSVLEAHDPSHASLSRSTVEEYNKYRLFGYQPNICNAPFNSLYLESRGRVYACCMSGNFVLGDIQEEKLTDIWDGEKAEMLRSDIEKLDLSKACMKCAKAIEGGVYDQAMSASYDTLLSTGKTRFPKRIDFELSNTCNLACIMCNGKNSSTYRRQIDKLPDKEPVYGHSFLEDLDTFLPHLQRANFLGGEPFLIDLYYDIWDRLLKVNPGCSNFIQTNGQVLNERIKSILSSGKFNIGISFESIRKEHYEKIRLYGKYGRLMTNIDWFSAYCGRTGNHLTFAVTPLRSTVHELPELLQFANSKGAELYLNIAIEPHDLVIWTMEPGQINEMLSDLQEFELPIPGNALERANIAQYRSFLGQMELWKKEAEDNEIRMEAILDLSYTDLVENIKEQIDEMIALEMRYNDHYASEYEEEKEQMLRSLDKMDNERDLRTMRLMAVMGPERMTSALAKMPENKADLMDI